MGTPPASSSARYKTLSLAVLIVQTTALVLVLRYSRTQKVAGPKYISSTAVLVSEAVKVVTCFLVLFKECNFRLPVLINAIDRDVIQRPADFFMMSVPAVLYVVQNNLLFLALSKLDAATYQVTYQLKILTTAFFTVVIMQRTLLRTQWLALLLLTGGVALVQMPSANSSKTEVAHDASDHFVGLISVIAACLTSGFAGVFLEKILKQGSIGLWMRNLQLAFFSIFGSLFMCWFYDGEAIERDGLLLSSFVSWFFLSDFSPSVCLYLFCSSVSSLLSLFNRNRILFILMAIFLFPFVSGDCSLSQVDSKLITIERGSIFFEFAAHHQITVLDLTETPTRMKNFCINVICALEEKIDEGKLWGFDYEKYDGTLSSMGTLILREVGGRIWSRYRSPQSTLPPSPLSSAPSLSSFSDGDIVEEMIRRGLMSERASPRLRDHRRGRTEDDDDTIEVIVSGSTGIYHPHSGTASPAYYNEPCQTKTSSSEESGVSSVGYGRLRQALRQQAKASRAAAVAAAAAGQHHHLRQKQSGMATASPHLHLLPSSSRSDLAAMAASSSAALAASSISGVAPPPVLLSPQTAAAVSAAAPFIIEEAAGDYSQVRSLRQSLLMRQGAVASSSNNSPASLPRRSQYGLVHTAPDARLHALDPRLEPAYLE